MAVLGDTQCDSVYRLTANGLFSYLSSCAEGFGKRSTQLQTKREIIMGEEVIGRQVKRLAQRIPSISRKIADAVDLIEKANAIDLIDLLERKEAAQNLLIAASQELEDLYVTIGEFGEQEIEGTE